MLGNTSPVPPQTRGADQTAGQLYKLHHTPEEAAPGAGLGAEKVRGVTARWGWVVDMGRGASTGHPLAWLFYPSTLGFVPFLCPKGFPQGFLQDLGSSTCPA